jgi:hypothetical protein
MSSTLRGYPSVSHVFLLAPMAAAAAFDVMILDPAVAVDLIPAGPLFRDQPHRYAALRKLPATLRLPGGRGRRLDVVLELLPWSEHRSELAISTTARPHLLVERSVAGYLQAANRYLSTLAERMHPRHLQADRGVDPVAAQVLAALRHGGATLPEPRTTAATKHANVLDQLCQQIGREITSRS